MSLYSCYPLPSGMARSRAVGVGDLRQVKHSNRKCDHLPYIMESNQCYVCVVRCVHAQVFYGIIRLGAGVALYRSAMMRRATSLLLRMHL